MHLKFKLQVLEIKYVAKILQDMTLESRRIINRC